MFPFSSSTGITRKTNPIPGSKGYGISNPSPLTNQYNLYGSAVDDDAETRDDLMRRYRGFGDSVSNNRNARGVLTPGEYKPGSYTPKPYMAPQYHVPTMNGMGESFKPELNQSPELFKPKTLNTPESYTPDKLGSPDLYNPKSFDYKRTDDFTDAIRNLKGLTESGGYTSEDIYNLRERGVSPIRSIYASAGRDIDRSRALSGGGTNASYSALKGRMARELSDKIGGITTDVNAGIAENVANNRVSLAPVYAGVTGNESGLANQYGRQNTDELNRADILNSGLINDTNRTNISEGNRAKLINVNSINDTNRENTNILNNASGMNTELINRLRQINTGTVNDASRYNIERRDRTNESNNQLVNSSNLFNTGESNRINNANTDKFNEADRSNVNNQNDARRINFELPFRTNDINRRDEGLDSEQLFRSIEGMRSLFGTTPALSQLFGNQALNFSGQQSGINQANKDNSMNVLMQILSQLRGRN